MSTITWNTSSDVSRFGSSTTSPIDIRAVLWQIFYDAHSVVRRANSHEVFRVDPSSVAPKRVIMDSNTGIDVVSTMSIPESVLDDILLSPPAQRITVNARIVRVQKASPLTFDEDKINVDDEVFVRLPPKRTITVKARIVRIQNATPPIIDEGEWYG